MASTLTAAPAHAVVGQPVNDSFAFTAKLDIGTEANKHSCSAALVAPQWLVTAASCFADDPTQSLKIPAGPLAPSLKTTATIGRSDLTRETGSVVDVVELAPRDDRDLVLAKLAKPVTNVTPVTITANAPISGQDLWTAGYGRTNNEWVPDRPHYAKFTVGTVEKTTVGLTPKTAGASICQGDTGGPAFHDIGGRQELAAINSRSWQGGCVGTDEKETRANALDTRVDDIADWIRKRVTPQPQPAPLGDYQVDVNGDGKADYLVVEDNGAVHAWLNNGGDKRGGWTDYGLIASGTGAPSNNIRLADINADGKADYLIVDDNGAVRAFINNGGDNHGGWTNYGTIATGNGTPGNKIRLADINGDRKADYLVVEDNGAVHAWLNNGGDKRGGWTDYGLIASGTGAPSNNIRLADINADGKADYLIVDDNGAVRAFINNGGDNHGGWTNYGTIATGNGTPGNKIRFADINGDRKADYLIVDDNGAVRAFINNGGDSRGGWSDYGQIASGTGAPGSKVRI
ncbi:FG-GAP-like repeat-containing protein [Streptomyces albireticuli]|uniref:FG-GAP-like repeat-containing protein n=1 Tax=Streptomyces albireticuli TaxID=1940 RepID=UPI00368738B1